MAGKGPDRYTLRFGAFELDPDAGELRKNGRLVNLQPQPARVLAILASRRGELISRDELQRQIWGEDTFVDFEHGVNFCVSRIRAALGDDAETPRYVETLPRRGYRFIAPVEQIRSSPATNEDSEPRLLPRDSATPERLGQIERPARSEGAPGLSLAAVPVPVPPEPVLLPFPVPKQPTPRSRAVPLTLAISVLALVSVGIYWLFPAPAPRVLRIRQLTHFGRAKAASYAATDGARIYFSEIRGGRSTIDEVSVTGGEPAPVPLPFPNAEVFDISPDHTELLVASFTGLEDEWPLWVIPVTGGSPRRLGDALGSSGAWSPDGQTVAYTRGSDLYTVNRDGNASRRLVSTPAPGGLTRLRWSPSGRMLRFTIEGTSVPTYSQWEVSADGSNLHPLPARPRSEPGADDGYGTWTPDGRYFVYRSVEGDAASIWAIRETGAMFRSFNRKPVELYAGPQFFFAPLLSTDGRRIFFIGDQERRELVRYDSASRQFIPYLSGIFARSVSFSKDGNRIAYNLSPGFTLWVSKPDGSDRRQLSFPPMQISQPSLSPDGRQIAVPAWNMGDQNGLYLFPTAGVAKPENLVPLKSAANVLGWFPDGQSLLFWRGPESAADPKLALYVLDLKTRKASLLPGSEGLHHGALSPDGLRVAALSDTDKSLVLFDLQTHRQIELAKGAALIYPCWSHDGREVFFQDVFEGSDQPIYRVRIADRKVERVTNFAQPFPADVEGYRLTGLTPDDSPLATLIRSNGDLYALDVDFP